MSEKTPKSKKSTTKSKSTTKAKSKEKTKPKAKPPTKTKKKRKKKAVTEKKPKPSRPRRLPLETPVKGVVLSYQRGTVQQRPQYALVKLEGITTVSGAASYIGRSVILHFNERTSNYGRIISVHGRNGILRVRFRRGLASDAIAKEIMVL